MWLYMLKVNKFKASEIQKHSDTLTAQEFQSAENQVDPGTEGEQLLAKHKRALNDPDGKNCASLTFEQLVVHRDNPMFLNCMLKDDLKITNLNERLKLIDVIARCKTPLEWLIIDEGACKGKGTCYDWFGMA